MSIWNSKYATLVRREFWEHRALWLAPVIVGGLMVIMPLLGSNMRFGAEGMRASGDAGSMRIASHMFGQATMIGVTMTLGGIACLAIFTYLLDGLYAERKDRSILFWKSLPVSDAQTVLAKRVPLMYALMPPATLILLEVMFLDSSHLARFIGQRLAPWTRSDWAWDASDPQRGLLPGLGSPDWGALFTNSSLWLGVAVAAAMVYLVIRLRRYRDDT